MKLPHPRRRGAIAIVTAIMLPVLIGFAGLAIDSGRLYVQKTELQNAADACALAAARELTCDPSAGTCGTAYLINAENSALTVAYRNNVDFQGTAISSTQVAASDVKFSTSFAPNSGYLSRSGGASAASKYAMCTVHQSGITPWFLGVLGVGNSLVQAQAVATLSPAMINCAIPIGMCMTTSGTSSSPFAGMTVGQWIPSGLTASATGSFGWIDFTPPSGGASELANLFKGTGACNVPPPPAQIGEQGNINSLAFAWNTRFGLYHGSDSVSTAAPDFTGYGYTVANWGSGGNAYGGTSSVDSTKPNFLTARTNNRPHDSDDGVTLPGGTSSSTSLQHKQYGADRRLVIAPVVDCSAWAGGASSQTVPVLGYACVLMLAPMACDSSPVYLEYRGKASDVTSPCATAGAVGAPGGVGPQVPALVQ